MSFSVSNPKKHTVTFRELERPRSTSYPSPRGNGEYQVCRKLVFTIRPGRPIRSRFVVEERKHQHESGGRGTRRPGHSPASRCHHGLRTQERFEGNIRFQGDGNGAGAKTTNAVPDSVGIEIGLNGATPAGIGNSPHLNFDVDGAGSSVHGSFSRAPFDHVPEGNHLKEWITDRWRANSDRARDHGKVRIDRVGVPSRVRAANGRGPRRSRCKLPSGPMMVSVPCATPSTNPGV